MTYYLITVFALYFLLMIILLIGWFKVTKKQNHSTNKFHFISIVVAARNEEKNIDSLLNSISLLNYPKNSFQVIVVDDHSKDKTQQVVSKFFESNQIENAKFFVSEGQGKKNALSLGINKAKGEIIVTTDADCTVPSNWLQRINEIFSDIRIQMCIGSVKIESQNFFPRLQSMEFASVIGTSAATLGLGYPTMCNGANLSFRKEVFEKVNGYEGNDQLASGDDQFLLQKINEAFSSSISFLNFTDAVVSTAPSESLSGFIEQRIRWAGKWVALKFHSQLLAVFIFLFQTSWLLILGWCSVHPSRILIILIITKVCMEFFFLFNINRFLARQFDFQSFFVLQFLYAPYVIWVSLLSRVKGFVWKERKHG